ncbi:9477_t:CDS:2, partial [Funneliformis mosseae]
MIREYGHSLYWDSGNWVFGIWGFGKLGVRDVRIREIGNLIRENIYSGNQNYGNWHSGTCLIRHKFGGSWGNNLYIWISSHKRDLTHAKTMKTLIQRSTTRLTHREGSDKKWCDNGDHCCGLNDKCLPGGCLPPIINPTFLHPMVQTTVEIATTVIRQPPTYYKNAEKCPNGGYCDKGERCASGDTCLPA